jgi:hypothetical protein
MAIVTIPKAGAAPLGFFVASPGALAPPSALLADSIDPFTHDYASLTTGVDPIDAQVLVALTILRDSGASVIGTGLRITDTKILADIQLTLASAVSRALSTLIAKRDIQLVAVDFGDDGEGVDAGNQVVNFAVKWVNLRALDRAVRQADIPLTSVRGGF